MTVDEYDSQNNNEAELMMKFGSGAWIAEDAPSSETAPQFFWS